MKSLYVLVVAALLLAPATALAGEAHETLLGIQVTNGTADLYGVPRDPAGYVSAYAHSEVGVGLQCWRLMTQDYAMNVSVGLGTFSETDRSSVPGNEDFKYTQSSWNVRVGGDRCAKVGERTIVYFGPGLQYWTGKAKFDGGAPSSGNYYPKPLETQAVSRFAVSGRVGGVMMLSDRLGLNCQIGRYVGYASASENGSKITWWPSGFEASGGLVVKL